MVCLIKDLFARRSLIKELVVKDLKIRYSQPVLGFFWAFLAPFVVVVIFYLIFSLILKVKIEEAPFLLYLMSAIFPWRFFQDSLISSTTSLFDNKNLLRESNFPHYLIPVSIILANAINFLPSLGIVIFACLFTLRGLPIFILFLPLVLIIHLFLATGISVILSILYVKFRDTKFIVESMLTLLFYLTPVFYSLYLAKSSFPSFIFNLYIYNPLVGILNMYRITLIKGFYKAIENTVNFSSLILTPLILTLLVLFLANYFYNKNKDYINDHLSY